MSGYDEAREQWIETGDPAWLAKMADALPDTREARMAAAGVPWIEVQHTSGDQAGDKYARHAARRALGLAGYILWGVLFAREKPGTSTADALGNWCDYDPATARWCIIGQQKTRHSTYPVQVRQVCSRCLVYGLTKSLDQGPLRVVEIS